ncbi:hypothetical protein [Streptosporangium subroseum]|uniref:hypothetical protein n=1 Tax=Streptosporangium subroseum TaxID=106412 RepID=UPI00308B7FE5|nr:hypothetical protein OHB15_49555 [Streptosporangium subroseum]
MAEAVISFAGLMPYSPGSSADIHQFCPCLVVRIGDEQLFRVHIQLSWEGSVNAIRILEGGGRSTEDARELLNDALLLYGMRRLEPLVKDWLSTDTKPENGGDVWELTTDDVPHLLTLAHQKSCSYQQRAGRDLYCTAASDDKTAVYAIGNRRAAPTTKPFCMECGLPDTTYMCSHLLHPEVTALTTAHGIAGRRVIGALCDKGRNEIGNPSRCQVNGHECWQRVIEVEPASVAPVSPLELAEAWDVLDAVWRLVFGKNKRLLSISSALVPAAISLDCTTRVEFASRVGALADLIDRTNIGDDLLPPGVKKQDTKGSIDALQRALLHKLPEDQHQAIKAAISTLHRVRDVRNTMAHNTNRGGGLTAKLHELGIYDAPPNWGSAWNAIRAHTAAALTAIRHELRRYDDNQTDT